MAEGGGLLDLFEQLVKILHVVHCYLGGDLRNGLVDLAVIGEDLGVGGHAEGIGPLVALLSLRFPVSLTSHTHFALGLRRLSFRATRRNLGRMASVGGNALDSSFRPPRRPPLGTTMGQRLHQKIQMAPRYQS